jgi:uncharacterized protein YjbJ (UPF0337 family)
MNKEVAGHINGNKKLENEGNVDQVKGAIHNAAGDVKDATKETFIDGKNPPARH